MKRLKLNKNLYWDDALRIKSTVKTIKEWMEENPEELYDFFIIKGGKGKRLQRHIFTQLQDKFPIND
jgi:hypothetical protein